MDIKQLFNDDDAVSPVIGVILMVAITVILAAVIASFVLGLGDQNNPAPTADFNFNYNSSAGTNGEVTVTHGDGDELNSDNVFIRGDQILASTFGGSSDQTWTNADGAGSAFTVSAGNSVDVELDTSPDEYVINVVWEDPDSDTTSTLSTDRGPDA
jgi:flagellin-like protein